MESETSSKPQETSHSEGIPSSNKDDITETRYVPDSPENGFKTEEEGGMQDSIPQDSKKLVFSLVKQVRIGMDLSKVVFPTFILEPRSMLEKLTDFLTHVELLVEAIKIPTPVERIIGIIRWYLSGFYMKPKGVKKPYNPILGEFFRCQWQKDDCKTLFISEQVSHHPPESAFYASNRKAGFIANGAIVFRSRFLGTSVGSVLDGSFILTILPLGEEYEITFPSVYAKGFLFGTLMMELTGLITVVCKKTGYKADIEFKSKPLFGGEYNALTGKVMKIEGNEELYSLSGNWDGKVSIHQKGTEKEKGNEKGSGSAAVLWQPTPELRKNKTPRFIPARETMEQFESIRLWEKVTAAIKRDDQRTATDEKYVLEQAQREKTKERDAKKEKWIPRFFAKNEKGVWTYKHPNKTVWNPSVEDEEYEHNGIICSRKKV